MQSWTTVEWKDLEIRKQIGEGSFGKVYLALWRETLVAVKLLHAVADRFRAPVDDEFPDASGPASGGSSSAFFSALTQEAAMMASLRHPCIVMYLGVSTDPPALITEYCSRGSLNEVLRRAQTSPSLASALDWPRRLGMALDAAKGMLYLHSCRPPIVHRDLKSPNLLVDRHWRVKVSDFNLSRVMDDVAVLSSLAATNPLWLAPEILAGKGCTIASDVYAFGIILWELLTWSVPWRDQGPWQVVALVTELGKRPPIPAAEDLPGTPDAFEGLSGYLALMQDCWAQQPQRRPNFTEIISRLRAILEDQLARRTTSTTASTAGALTQYSAQSRDTPSPERRRTLSAASQSSPA